MNHSILRDYPRPYLTDNEMASLLSTTPGSRYGKVKRLIADGMLLSIRRGLYGLTEKAGYASKPHPFELAQYVYGPSYISLESALSYHQLIPEGVYTITCVTTKRSKQFQTPLGTFNYSHLPLDSFYCEVVLIQEDGYCFFMAKPWKAICDYVFCYKKDWVSLRPLVESLRIELENLPLLGYEELEVLDAYYQQRRLSRFLKGVKKELLR